MTRFYTIFLTLLLVILAACDALPDSEPTLPNIRLEVNTPAPENVALQATPTSDLDAPYVPMLLPDGLRDELPVMSGICFEAAYDAAGRLFVLGDATAHIRFYELADRAGLCRHPVTRYPFDFTTGRVLAGLWSRGMGCTARHELLEYQRDDEAKTIVLRVKFITEGDCPYELVRPFWVSIAAAAGYGVAIEVE